jgi:ABC-2 type transport system ATP-binding protein
MPNPILEIDNVTKVYRDKNNTVHALDGVNLTIYEGEILGLLGVNGAGKTTLSSILATLHPPTSGSIFYNGQSIYTDLLSYRKNIGFCPQSPNLDPYLNVRENLEFAGRYFLMSEQEVQGRLKELMDQFDLEKYATFKIDQLSGGWKRRVLIARALMHNPKIVLLDEPTVGLDPDIRRILWDYISKLKELGVTVILTTHYLDEAEVLSDRVCILDKGKDLLVASVSDIKAQHKKTTLEEAFIAIVNREKPHE